MLKTTHQEVPKDKEEVSIATTLLRTLSLTGLTFIFLAIVRFWAPAMHLMQRVAGSAAWARLAGLLRIETGLGREQFIFVGIVVFCFVLALIVQSIVYAIIRFCRGRYAA
ncbi:hypothetical protein D5366_01465 [Neokomagataea tanensis]|uniref:Uncharacterized protein n=2 Tax=Neokomagataea TaxID=1223423 RepID=A0A4Y6V6Q1_9PROT|nr:MULTISPECIES: hypothetical protein [Neokomagataea]QDH25749.1 hypothetical protein D5366_01465 [Neokomagataea tanensis]